MDRDDLFLVLEHINEFKENKYKALRANQLSKKSEKQLSLLDKAHRKNEKVKEKIDLKVIN